MSAFAAIFGASGDIDRRLKEFERPLGGLPHDDLYQWHGNGCGFVTAKLHTTRGSLEPRQPIENRAAGIALAFNGFLSNAGDLRRDLEGRGATLRNRSDEELVLRAFERWGDGCADRLQGEFALVVIDSRHNRVFCARDHQGLRPLYYAVENGILLAATQLPALLAGLAGEPTPNLDYIAEAATGEILSVDQTAWSGVKRLQAAHCMVFDANGLTIRRYYELPCAPIRRFRTDRDYVEEYRAVLRSSVLACSRTHVPLACEISGGLDSTAIFAVAHGLDHGGNLPAPALLGFTMRGEPGEPSDEIAHARAAAEFLGRDLDESALFRPNLDWFLDRAARDRDLPTLTNVAQSLDMERAIADAGCRVVLNGLGGDQWLDGSIGYYEQNWRKLAFRRLWQNLINDIPVDGFGGAMGLLIRKGILAAMPHTLRSALRKMKPENGRIFNDDLQYLKPRHAERIREAKRQYEDGLPVDRVARKYQRALDSISNQRGFDAVNHQHSRMGIEGRSPMFTRPFIEFCLSVPEDLKLRGDTTKWMHREAMRGLLPDTVLGRQDKASFPERKHDTAIAAQCAKFLETGNAGIFDEDALVQVTRGKVCGELDDDWGRQYWGILSAIAFLSNADRKQAGGGQTSILP